MSKQQNPISICRIHNFDGTYTINEMNVNPNGTYTIKEVNDNPSEGDCLSRIAVYDSLGRLINFIYFIDKNFKDIWCKGSRKYLDDEKYYETTIYEKPLDAKIFSCKCLHDKSGKFLKYWHYSDKKLRKLLYTVECEYLDNGQHCGTFYLEKPTDYGCILCKRLYDETGKYLKNCYYKDNEQTELYVVDYFEYLSDKKYIKKSIFEEAYNNMYSMIQYFNVNDVVYFTLGYKDKEFKNLYRPSKVKYTKNGSIIFRIYAESQDGYNIEIEKYDNNKKLISKKQYYLVRLFAKILLGLLDFFTTRVKYV